MFCFFFVVIKHIRKRWAIFNSSKIQFSSIVTVTCTNDSFECADLDVGGGLNFTYVYVFEIIYFKCLPSPSFIKKKDFFLNSFFCCLF